MKYPLFKVHVDVPEAMKNIEEVLRSGFINEGETVTELTDAFKKRFKTERLVLTNSCTSAITVALRLAGAYNNSGSVLTTPMTCVATNCPIVTNGGNIQWADIDPKTGCMDPKDLRKKLDRDPYVKAVLCVAWAGVPPYLSELKEICNEFNVPLILDAAHAFGAKYHDQFIHEWADYTCYSLQAIKHVTSGDGGILVTQNKENFKRAKCLKWFGLDRDASKDEKGNWKGQRWETDITEVGYKFAMNNISAALGLSQLSHINDIIEGHRVNAETYDELFSNSTFVSPLTKPFDSVPSHWVYSMTVSSTINRDQLVEDLNSEEIGAGLVHLPNDIYSCFNQYKESLPGVREFESKQFSIPVGWWLNKNDIDHIYNRVIELCKKQLND